MHDMQAHSTLPFCCITLSTSELGHVHALLGSAQTLWPCTNVAQYSTRLVVQFEKICTPIFCCSDGSVGVGKHGLEQCVSILVELLRCCQRLFCACSWWHAVRLEQDESSDVLERGRKVPLKH